MAIIGLLRRANQRRSGMRHQPMVLLALVLASFGVIAARLIWLQLIEGSRYRELADENRIRLVPRPPIRGRLLDRDGEVLASSRLAHNLYVLPRLVNHRQWPPLRDRLADLLALSPLELDRRRLEAASKGGYRWLVARNLKPEQVLRFYEQAVELNGAEVDPEVLRAYPHGRLAAHLLGYTSGLTEQEYDQLKNQSYRLQDRIGRSGVEQIYEKRLRGSWGGQQLEVNAMGEVQRVLGDKPAQAGRDLSLTLDLSLQQVAEKALDQVQKGAIVALDPQTGAIRAMASRPNFDPNVFSTGPSVAQWNVLNRPEAPLLNRALQGFPPASTFKIVTSIAALESGQYGPESQELSTESFCFEGLCYRDHGAYGKISFPMALQVSSNSVFYRVGLKIGPDALFDAARRMGYGSRTGFEFEAEEAPGLLGDQVWKLKVFGEPWRSVDTITAAIGQGAVEVTPLQMARMYAAIANGGYLVTPHLVERPLKRTAIGLQPSTLEIIRKGLRLVVTSGTATLLKDSALPPVAGKTGTAEAPPGRDHVWFAAYAPEDQPTLVVVALGENSGGFGGTVAAPLVKAVMVEWFKDKQDSAGRARAR